MKCTTLALLLAPLSITAALPAPTEDATILFVDAAAPAGGTGTSWISALDDLQAALSIAAGGGVDEIWVAAGTYLPSSTGDVMDSFELVDGVSLYGGFAGGETEREQRDPATNLSILSGDLAGDDQVPSFAGYDDNSQHVVVAGASVTNATVVDGLTIRGGFARFPEVFGFNGGGMYVVGGEPRIHNMVFRENITVGFPGGGGGLFVARSGEIEVTESTFFLNGTGSRAFLGGRTDDGGGIHFFRTNGRVERCTFDSGEASDGAGIYAELGSLVVEDCGFQGNHAGGGAGIGVVDAKLTLSRSTFTGHTGAFGVVNIGFSDADSVISECLFEGNQLTSGGGVALFFNDGGSLHCADTVFRLNTVSRAGGMDCSDTDVTVERCLFEGNQFVSGGGIYTADDGNTITVKRSVFRSNVLVAGAGNGAAGGGITVVGLDTSGPTVIVEDSVFVNNDRRPIDVSRGGDVRLDGCSLYRPIGAELVRVAFDGSVRVTNSVLWNPLGTPAFGTTGTGNVTIDHSCVVGGAPGTGNIAVDPLFTDAAGGDLSLLASSPCVDAGDAASVPVRLDIDGDPRVVDGELDGSVVRDMGADERNAVRLSAVATASTQLTVTTSGTPGLATLLIAGAPAGGTFFPKAGALFIDLTGPVATAAWPATPSSRTVELPPALSLPFELQALAIGATGRSCSNPVSVPSLASSISSLFPHPIR